jgi:hypothetical protein
MDLILGSTKTINNDIMNASRDFNICKIVTKKIHVLNYLIEPENRNLTTMKD